MSNQNQSLTGRAAVVTGGSRGIGAEICRTLAAAGAAVIAAARSRDEIDRLADELRQAGCQAWAVPCDVSDPDQVAALRQAAADHVGQVDILVNNAGIAISAPLKAIQLSDWERMFAVNVTGTFLCAQAFLPAMVESGWGRVVNIASVAGKVGAPYISAYTASKHAVVGFTRALAVEVAQSGVTVNAVCPGYVESDMVGQAVNRIVEKTRVTSDEARRRLAAMSPQQRIFTPEEVAYQVLCLCDSRAKGINGQAVVIDGGMVQS